MFGSGVYLRWVMRTKNLAIKRCPFIFGRSWAGMTRSCLERVPSPFGSLHRQQRLKEKGRNALRKEIYDKKGKQKLKECG